MKFVITRGCYTPSSTVGVHLSERSLPDPLQYMVLTEHGAKSCERRRSLLLYYTALMTAAAEDRAMGYNTTQCYGAPPNQPLLLPVSNFKFFAPFSSAQPSTRRFSQQQCLLSLKNSNRPPISCARDLTWYCRHRELPTIRRSRHFQLQRAASPRSWIP